MYWKAIFLRKECHSRQTEQSFQTALWRPQKHRPPTWLPRHPEPPSLGYPESLDFSPNTGFTGVGGEGQNPALDPSQSSGAFFSLSVLLSQRARPFSILRCFIQTTCGTMLASVWDTHVSTTSLLSFTPTLHSLDSVLFVLKTQTPNETVPRPSLEWISD